MAATATDVPTGLQFAEPDPIPSHFNVLLWAPAKQGKSTAAATAPGPILWLNAEGVGALGYARKIAAERGTVIHEVTVDKKRRDAVQVLDRVYQHLRAGAEPRCETVVVDTVAKVRDALIEQLVDKGSSGSLRQYGKVADKLGGFIFTLRDFPVNLILLAHADYRESDEEGRVVLPKIGGQLTETIPGEVDVVAYVSPHYLEGGGVEYVGQLRDGKGRTGLGDRSGALAGDAGYRVLDLSEWLEAYRAGLTPESAPADDADLPFDVEEPAAESPPDPEPTGGRGPAAKPTQLAKIHAYARERVVGEDALKLILVEVTGAPSTDGLKAVDVDRVLSGIDEAADAASVNPEQQQLA